MIVSHNRAPWTERLYDLLAKGPKRREVVISETASLVPPARAAAYVTRRFKKRRARDGFKGIQPRPPMPIAESILSGQQCLVRESLRGQILLGTIIAYEEDGVSWVRLLTSEEEEAREAQLRQQRHKSVKKAWATRREHPEAIVESYRRGVQTKLAKNPNALSEAYQRGIETKLSKNPDALSAAAKKGWETRRQRRAA